MRAIVTGTVVGRGGRWARRRLANLEEQFQGELNKARVASAEDFAEGATGNGVAVRDVPVHFTELRVIDDVEEFDAKLHVTALVQASSLHEAEVEVVDAGPAADGAWGRADAARLRLLERCGIEGEAQAVAWVELMEGRHDVRLAG